MRIKPASWWGLILCLIIVMPITTFAAPPMKEFKKIVVKAEKLQLLLHEEIESYEDIYERFHPYMTDQFLQAYVDENTEMKDKFYQWKKEKPLQIPRFKDGSTLYLVTNKKNMYVYQEVDSDRYDVVMFQQQKGDWKIADSLRRTMLPSEIKIEHEPRNLFEGFISYLKSLRIF